jgi:hypothetical protein
MTDDRPPTPGARIAGPEHLPGVDLADLPALDGDGLDRSLIRESLARTPLERLDLADAYAQEIEALRSCLRPGRARVPGAPLAGSEGRLSGEP